MPVDLRRALLQITETVPLPAHGAVIQRLCNDVGHSIVVLESDYPIERYTCAVHAFDLVGEPTYESVASHGLGFTFAGREFMNFLLANGLIFERDAGSSVAGDLILYFDSEVFRHVGRLRTATRVESKWGTGNLYEHGIWEIPSDYGNEIRYFKGPAPGAGLDLFIRFAESKGFNFGRAE